PRTAPLAIRTSKGHDRDSLSPLVWFRLPGAVRTTHLSRSKLVKQHGAVAHVQGETTVVGRERGACGRTGVRDWQGADLFARRGVNQRHSGLASTPVKGQHGAISRE